MNILALVTQYSFWITFCGMAAATLYFLAERNSLPEQYRSTASVSAVYTFIAAINYFVMKDIAGLDGNMESLLGFPTAFRYIDWLITTPLILIKFPMLMNDNEEVDIFLFAMALVVLDVLMIVCGYFGEISINAAGGPTLIGWAMFMVGFIAWLLIIITLVRVINVGSKTRLKPIRQGLSRLKYFIIFGWAIYPIGYLATLFVAGNEVHIVRELIYNIADLINKVGFGLIAIFAVSQLAKEQEIRKAIDSM